VSIRERLRHLEDRGGCPECYLKPEAVHVYYPDEGDPVPEPECCPKCGRALGVVLRVQYEGEGAYLDERLPRN
jgi:hypothetical protein